MTHEQFQKLSKNEQGIVLSSLDERHISIPGDHCLLKSWTTIFDIYVDKKLTKEF